MSSHVRMIVARHGKQNLEAVIRDIKKYRNINRSCARDAKKNAKVLLLHQQKLIEAIRDNHQDSRKELFLWLFETPGKIILTIHHYPFWQQHSQPIELNTNESWISAGIIFTLYLWLQV